jgi:D-glycero-D-manno-heptose 1,7-bisphosphate phosphatase
LDFAALLLGVNMSDFRSQPSAISFSDRGIFLDRDGTLIVNRHYLADPAGVELLPGVRDALHGLAADGYKLFLFTNQSGVGRGMFTMETVHRCNERMTQLLGIGFVDTCIAPEAPDQPSVYRKPSPKFIVEMIAKHGLNPRSSWMVGDSDADVQAGLNAGVRTARLSGCETPPTANSVAEWTCAGLPEFYLKLAKSKAEC